MKQISIVKVMLITLMHFCHKGLCPHMTNSFFLKMSRLKFWPFFSFAICHIDVFKHKKKKMIPQS